MVAIRLRVHSSSPSGSGSVKNIRVLHSPSLSVSRRPDHCIFSSLLTADKPSLHHTELELKGERVYLGLLSFYRLNVVWEPSQRIKECVPSYPIL